MPPKRKASGQSGRSAPPRRSRPAAGSSAASTPAAASASRTPSLPAFSSRKLPRSVWNAPDDWAQLVADSALSTSSVSSRRPRPRGVHSLARAAQDAAARSWRRMWDEDRGAWRAAWDAVPAHLQRGVRDGVFKWHAAVLTLDIIRDAFIVAPDLVLPGALLPALAPLAKLKPLHPARPELITSLTLTHLAAAEDVAVAMLVWRLPALEAANLKGCALVGERTVDALVKRCPALRRVNLKGTKVGEHEVVSLLDTFSAQLEAFKIDTVALTGTDTFAMHPFRRLTHLCLPGDAAAPISHDLRLRAQKYGQTLAYPAPRAPRPGADLTWERLGAVFPALTHLSLPGIYLLPDAHIGVAPGTLRKLVLGPGGPPVPVPPLVELVRAQPTLEKVYLGHLIPTSNAAAEFAALGEALAECDMVDFRLETDAAGSKDWRCDNAMAQYSHLLYAALGGRWAPTLKHLVVSTPEPIPASAFATSSTPALERLEIASATMASIDTFAADLRAYVNLRSLDLSGTAITDEHLFSILDHCQLLSRIDLTSCRGVDVRYRRNFFKAWEDDRRSRA